MIFTFGLIACVVFIFSNSAKAATVSSKASTEVLAAVRVALSDMGFADLARKVTEHFVRKLAHFCEYTLEGFLLMLCLRVYTKRFIRHISWPVLFGLLTALIDETIQIFSPGRSSQVTDIWIDFAGVLTGLFVGLFLLMFIRMCVLLYRHRNED